MLKLKQIKSKPLVAIWDFKTSTLMTAVICIAFGIVAGCLFERYLSGDERVYMLSSVNKYLLFKEGNSADFAQILLTSLKNNTLLFVMILLSGLSIFLYPLAYAFLTYKSASIGFASALLVETMQSQGILMVIFTLFLPALLLIPAMLLSTISASNLARSILSCRKGECKKNLRQNASPYIFTNAIIFLLIAGGCIIETLTCRLVPVIFQ